MNLVRFQHAERVISRASEKTQSGDRASAWKLLEDAHIFSQPFASLHLYVHWLMLNLAISDRNFGEIFGQIMRLLVAVPGSWTKLYPVGNPGRSNVNMFVPLPLSKGMAAKIRELEKLEKRRIDNGGVLPKYQRQHPLTRR